MVNELRQSDLEVPQLPHLPAPGVETESSDEKRGPATDPARELLAFLRAAGYSLRAVGDRLFVDPGEKLSAAEAGQVRALKAGILAALGEEQAEARWVKCEACHASYDNGLEADVRRFCDRSACHLKPQEKKRWARRKR